MDLENALQTAVRLRELISDEIQRARDERRLLRSLDASALFARAAQRAVFLADAARLERLLGSSLQQVASASGMPALTLERLRKLVPSHEGTTLAEVLSEVRALAGALQEIDRLNVDLARRALRIVRGYVDTLQPTPRAYDRRGTRTGAPALAVVSSEG